MEPKELLGPACTLIAGWLIASSIRNALGDGRVMKVEPFEVELGSKDSEVKKLQQQLKRVSEDLSRLRQSHNN